MRNEDPREIYIPLTAASLNDRVEKAIDGAAASFTSGRKAREETLHFGLRNCIWQGNTECMMQTLTSNRGLELNRNFGLGSLLFYAASLPILTQTTGTLAPVRILLERHADPLASQEYQLSYRAPTLLRQGSFIDYLSHIVNHIAGKAPDPELAAMIDGYRDKVIDSIIYIKGQLIRRDPELVLGTSLIGLRRTGITAIRQATGAFAIPVREKMPVLAGREIAAARAGTTPTG